MSDSAASSSEKPKKTTGDDKRKHSAAAIYGRIAFYAVVVGIIGVIVFIRQDRVVQNAFAQTTKAWVDELDVASDADEVLRRSQLPAPIGDPEIGEMVAESDVDEASQHQLYTWKGVLNTFRAEVHYASGEDPYVVEIKKLD